MRQLTKQVSVCGQIFIDDVSNLAAAGIKTLINNRPDFEDPLQPKSDELEKAAKALGLDYWHIPMSSGLSLDMIEASSQAYASSDGPILAFCRSGTRSTTLWCFANVQACGVDSVLKIAHEAGYPLEQLRRPLNAYLEQITKN